MTLVPTVCGAGHPVGQQSPEGAPFVVAQSNAGHGLVIHLLPTGITFTVIGTLS